MKIISIAIAFSAITLLMFCSCTKDKKATEIPIPIDYRDAYCGTFTGYETTRAWNTAESPAVVVFDQHPITIAVTKSTTNDSMLVFSNLAEQVKFKILNSSGDNDLRANIGTKTLMGGFIYGSKDSFNYDIRTIYPQGQHPTDPLFTNVWVKRNQ